MCAFRSKFHVDASGGLDSLAILLKKFEFGESDMIVTFFTMEFGKLKAFARKAKKSKKRFGTSLDIFAYLEANFGPPAREDSLFVLNSIAPVGYFENLRKNFQSIAMGSYFAELYDEMTPENVKNEELFDLLVRFLSFLDRGYVSLEVFPLWVLRFMRAVGLGPNLSGCALCGKKTDNGKWFFKVDRGGLACGGCALADDPMNIGLKGETLNILKREDGYSDNFLKRLKLGFRQSAELRKIVDRFIQFHLGRRLNASKFMEEVNGSSLERI